MKVGDLAYRGKELVKILRITKEGAVALYESYNEPGNLYMPLIIDNKNVEKFKLVKSEQSTMF